MDTDVFLLIMIHFVSKLVNSGFSRKKNQTKKKKKPKKNQNQKQTSMK